MPYPKVTEKKPNVNNRKHLEGVRYSIKQLVDSNMTWKEMD